MSHGADRLKALVTAALAAGAIATGTMTIAGGQRAAATPSAADANWPTLSQQEPPTA